MKLKKKLGPLADKVIGVTPEIEDPFLHYPRQMEVELYLKQESQEQASWFALDDTPAFYKADAPVLLINGRIGFTIVDGSRLDKLIRSL